LLRRTRRTRFGLYAVNGFADIEGSPLEAGIDTTKDKLIGVPAYELQNKYLGAILPSAAVIKKISKWAGKKKFIAGIVHDKRPKVSKFGPYTVYRLVPDGVFWIRDGEDLESGQIVAVRTNQKTGRALEIKHL